MRTAEEGIMTGDVTAVIARVRERAAFLTHDGKWVLDDQRTKDEVLLCDTCKQQAQEIAGFVRELDPDSANVVTAMVNLLAQKREITRLTQCSGLARDEMVRLIGENEAQAQEIARLTKALKVARQWAAEAFQRLETCDDGRCCECGSLTNHRKKCSIADALARLGDS